MEFKLALKEIAKSISLDDDAFDLKCASAYKKQCQTNNDLLQLQEYKCIAEASQGFVKELYLAYKAGEEENDDFSALADKIEEIAKNLEKHEISCYTYAYYISAFLELFYELYQNPSYKKLKIKAVRWLNPSEQDYMYKLSLTDEPSFGFGRFKVKLSDFEISRGVLKSFKGKAPNVIIPNGVRVIDKGAFKNSVHLKSIYIPDSVVKIGKEAFFGCTSLETVFLSKNALRLPASCFEGCVKLKRINTQNIIEVGSKCFKDCSSLDDSLVFYALSQVRSEAFANCKKMKKADFVSQLTEIGSRAFEGCGFISISLEKCKRLSKEAFLNCLDLERIELTSIPQGLQDEAFKGCHNVKAINLERNKALDRPHLLFYKKLEDFNEKMILLDSVRQDEIKQNQFAGYKNIKTVEIRSSEIIPSGAFCGCEKLEAVIVRTPIKEIGKNAFYGCASLKMLDMRYDGDTLQEGVFYRCERLEYIDSLLPNVTSFGKRSLAYTDLRGFNFNRKFKRLDGFCFANAQFPKENVRLDLKGVLVQNGVFHGIGDILGLRIDYTPNIYKIFDKTKEEFSKRKINHLFTYGEIDYGAFADYSNIRYIEFDANKQEVSPSAFDGCTSLESVKVRGKINKIGKFAFKDCKSLQNLDIEGEINEVDTGAFFACVGASSLIDITKLKSIGKYAFAKTDIKALMLSKGVEYIGQGAFFGCPILGEISLPFVGVNKTADGNEGCLGTIFTENPENNQKCPALPQGVEAITILSTELPKNAFIGCSQIKSIKLPRIKELINSAFSGCSSLDSLEIGKELSTFSPLSIKELTSKTKIVLDADCENFVQKNGSIFSRDEKSLYYLSHGDKLEDVIPDINRIEEYAVFISPEVLNIPNNIKGIASNAINCQGTREINISGAKNIDPSAFYNCSSLDNIELEKASVLGAFSFDEPEINIKKLTIKNVTLGSIKEIINEAGKIYIDTLDMCNAPIKNSSYFDLVENVESLNISNASQLGIGALSLVNIKNLYMVSPTLSLKEMLSEGKELNSLTIENANITSNYFDGISLNTLTLKNIEEISKNAFFGNSIETLTIDKVLKIAPFAFSGSTINDIKITNSKYEAMDGIIYKNNSLVYCYDKSFESIEISEGIKLVCEGAFENIDTLRAVFIEGEETYLDKNAFCKCNQLRSLELGNILNKQLSHAFSNANTIKYISYFGKVVKRKFFAGLTALREVIFKETEKVYDLAFSGCSSLEGIKGADKLKRVGDMAFYNCRALKTIKLNDGCEFVGISAFEGCISLRSLQYPITNQHQKYQITAQSLFGITRTNEVNAFISASRVPAYYFSGFEGRISILGTPQEIGEGAFIGANLEAISLKDVKVIEKKSFYESSIKLANMPSVSIIGDYAFAFCKRLESITINGLVEKISPTWVCNSPMVARLDGASNGVNYTTVSNCLVLNQSKELIYCAPKNEARVISFGGLVKRVGKTVFENAILTELDLSDAEYIEKDALRSCKSLRALSLGSLKDNDGKSQKLSYFVDTDKLTRISLKSATLLDGAFEGFKSLKSVEIEKPLKKVPANCFKGCVSLEALPSFDEVSSFGKDAFVDCMSIEALALPYLGKTIDSPRPLSYFFGENKPNIKSLVINGGQLSDSAFVGIDSLKRVELKNSVTKIPDECFSGCSSLQDIGGYGAVEEIGTHAFLNCRALYSVKFTGVKQIGERAFAGCTSLIKAEINSPVLEEIGNEVFKGTRLEELTIKLNSKVGTIDALGIKTPNKLKRIHIFGKTIYQGAFENCTKLKTVTSDEKITEIGDFAFAGCDEFIGNDILVSAVKIGIRAFYKCLALKSIELKSAKELGKEAFMGCTSLKTAVLSNGLEKILERSFAGCTSLERINIPASLEVLGERAFMETAMKKCELKMPKSLCKVGKFVFENADSPIVFIKPREDRGWDPDWMKNCKRHGFLNASKKVIIKKY